MSGWTPAAGPVLGGLLSPVLQAALRFVQRSGEQYPPEHVVPGARTLGLHGHLCEVQCDLGQDERRGRWSEWSWEAPRSR